MSPASDSSAAPAPPRAALQAVPAASEGGPFRRGGAFLLAVITIGAAAAWWLRPRPQNRPSPSVLRTVKAVRGALARTLRLTGSIAATRYANIAAPILRAPDTGRGLVLIYVPRFGAMVRKGDVLARIDGQAMKDHLDDVEAAVDQTEMDLKKLRSQQIAAREALEQSVRAARADWEKAKQDMLTLQVRSAIQREQFRLAEEEAKANYDEVHGELALLAERQKAEWNVAAINQESQVHHRNRHRIDLERCTILAPISGQVVMKTIVRNGEIGQVQLGDELAPGQPFMRVVDPTSMELDATVNQVDADSVRLGQKATVHFDAYPGLTVEGTVEAVGTLAVNARRINYYVRQVPVRITIGSGDARVIPDLTASADVVVAEQDGAVIIPREAVQDNAGRTIVYVKEGETVAPREVELGLASNTQVAVIAGLHEGEEIAIQPADARP